MCIRDRGMSRTEVINAVYTDALNLKTVDKDSFSAFTKDGFYFTVDGMYCAYNYSCLLYTSRCV